MEFIWNKFIKNEREIKKDEIKMPAIIIKKDTLTVGLDHYSYKEISFIIQNKNFDFEISDFNLSKIVNNSPNLNYKHNLETIRNKIHIDIEKLINDIEEKNLIKKINLYKTIEKVSI